MKTENRNTGNKTPGKAGGFIGICAKAGKICAGEFLVEKSVKTGKARLCLIASDISPAAKKKIGDMCRYRSVPLYDSHMTKAELGHIIGKEDRVCLVLEDEGMAGYLTGLLDGGMVNEQ